MYTNPMLGAKCESSGGLRLFCNCRESYVRFITYSHQVAVRSYAEPGSLILMLTGLGPVNE